MSLTLLSSAAAAMQVSSGLVPPAAPADPAVDNLFTQLDAAGTPVAVFVWPAGATAWQPLPSPAVTANNAQPDPFGWVGRHDNASRLATAHTSLTRACSYELFFSCHAPSTSPVPFEIQDLASGSPVTLATGVFPAGAKHATAADCVLVDAASMAVTTLAFIPTTLGPVAHLAAVPVGGHAAMPATGETLQVDLVVAY